MLHRTPWLLAPAAALLLVQAAPAHAAPFPENELYIAAHGGALVDVLPWDLGVGTSENGLRPELSTFWLGGAKLGWQANDRCSVEAGAFVVPLTSTTGGNNLALEYNVDALYHLSDLEVTPYALAGIGAYHNLSGDLGGDLDPAAQIGLGLRAMVQSGIALRGEARHTVTDGFQKFGAANLEFRVGIDIFPASLMGSDSDGDGIQDASDSCPQVPGVATANGCPDQDGDGVADGEDACVDVYGLLQADGCPDGDGDGIADGDDTCPTVFGQESAGGCPDRDGDGVADEADSCVDVAGLAELAGCPDGDGDGIADAEDVCPTEPGRKATQGCPDGDRDGVADKDDKCPEVRGLKNHDGCVPDEVKEFTGAIKGITFESGSATIKAASYKTLDRAVGVMKRFEGLTLQIEGHTDDQGEDASNQKLSEERAAAVVAYFVDKGVDAARLKAVGFGETKPVADNGTADGRAQNRRIEFVILEK
jgi:OOP family OmpA-OmpF porin